jgi:hypothetical protein
VIFSLGVPHRIMPNVVLHLVELDGEAANVLYLDPAARTANSAREDNVYYAACRNDSLGHVRKRRRQRKGGDSLR